MRVSHRPLRVDILEGGFRKRNELPNRIIFQTYSHVKIEAEIPKRFREIRFFYDEIV